MKRKLEGWRKIKSNNRKDLYKTILKELKQIIGRNKYKNFTVEVDFTITIEK